MQSSIKQLQKERMMWQALSQEAQLHCDDAQSEIHWQKSNGRTLVWMQVDKAIRNEHELKSYISELQGMHSGPQLRERKAKRAAIQASKHWKKVADKRMNKINKLGEMSDEFKDDLTRVTKEMESNHFSVSKSEFSWEFCPECHKQAMLGIMAVNNVAESALGGAQEMCRPEKEYTCQVQQQSVMQRGITSLTDQYHQRERQVMT
jgi:hypothetical protein